jgi:hypothetical protein
MAQFLLLRRLLNFARLQRRLPRIVAHVGDAPLMRSFQQLLAASISSKHFVTEATGNAHCWQLLKLFVGDCLKILRVGCTRSSFPRLPR